jgi:hypothetical protein
LGPLRPFKLISFYRSGLGLKRLQAFSQAVGVNMPIFYLRSGPLPAAEQVPGRSVSDIDRQLIQFQAR